MITLDRRVVAGVLLTLCHPAYAQATAPPLNVDSARLAAAEEFAKAIDLRKQLQDANAISAAQMESQVFTAFVSSDPRIKAAREKDPEGVKASIERLQAALAQEVRTLNLEMEPEVYRETVAIYARTFDVDELRQITVFYASPLGAKLLEKQPQLMRECIELSQRLVLARVPAMVSRLKQTLGSDLSLLGKSPE